MTDKQLLHVELNLSCNRYALSIHQHWSRHYTVQCIQQSYKQSYIQQSGIRGMTVNSIIFITQLYHPYDSMCTFQRCSTQGGMILYATCFPRGSTGLFIDIVNSDRLSGPNGQHEDNPKQKPFSVLPCLALLKGMWNSNVI